MCSEGAAISGPLQEVVELIEHQTRDPGSGFKAAEQHWTDKVCSCTALLTGTAAQCYLPAVHCSLCLWIL